MNFCKYRYFTHRLYGSLSSDSLPVITIPSYLMKNLRKLRAKQELERLEEIRGISRMGNKRVPIISCRHKPELNHYLGRVYDSRRELPLISQHWQKGKYKGQSFTIHKHAHNPCILDPTDSSFANLGLDSRIVDILQKKGFKTPSAIQEQAIPVILSGVNAACCAETGSGKTLSYVAPLVQLLMRKKVCKGNAERPSMSPLAIVLLPSKELVLQIGEVVKSLAEECGLFTCVLAPGMDFQRNLSRAQTQGEVDIVVATAGALHTLAVQRVVKLSYVDHVIVDEADTLVDNSFIDVMGQIMKDISIQEDSDVASLNEDAEWFPNCSPPQQMGSQLVLVGATLPKQLEDSFGDLVDLESLTWVKTGFLHHLPPHLTHVFHRLGKEEKEERLLKEVSKQLLHKRPLMVFCNRTPAAIWTSEYLSNNEISNVSLYKELTNSQRRNNLAAFQEGSVNVICCTDLASRGLDTLRTKTILNYDFPGHMSDYIHRAGRTGRLGAPTPGGQVINFVSSKWDVLLLQQIEMATRRVIKLPDVDANIKRKYEEYAVYKENKMKRRQ